MAEGNREDESPYFFHNSARKRDGNDSDDSDGVEDSYVKPDLGIGDEPSFEKRENVASGAETQKREENPFSFKHFLRRDTASGHHGTGARPKVYSNSSSDASFSHLTTPDSDPGLCSPSTRPAPATPRHPVTPELTSILPDFVQDHLVVEQCYLGHDDQPRNIDNIDLDNLPDFAYSGDVEGGVSWGRERRTCQVSEVLRSDDDVCMRDASDTRNTGLPFDLPRVRGETPLDLPCSPSSFNRGHGSGLPFDLPRVRGETPLDLPSGSPRGLPFDLPSPTRSDGVGLPFDLPRVRGVTPLDLPCGAARVGGLPFDLPLVGAYGSDGEAIPGSRATQAGEAGVNQSLPDFLSDGPIHSSLVLDTAQPTLESPDSTCPSPPPLERLPEAERLRRELEAARRRVVALERELATLRSKDQEEMVTLEKAIEQVEDNLKRSTRRAVTAENTVSKLKQEIKSLASEVSSLRQENRTLRHCGGAGAGAGPGAGGAFTQDELHAQRIAQDLRHAASTAEQSLRTLIAGVGNLRAIASSIDNITRVQDRTRDYDMRSEEDDLGPAL